jgi:hypothetical protein
MNYDETNLSDDPGKKIYWKWRYGFQKMAILKNFLFRTHFYIVLVFFHELCITNEKEIKFFIQWLSHFLKYITSL